jgi:hypothetical protein
MRDEDDMNLLHFTILDNDLQQIKILEQCTLIEYYANLDTMMKVNEKRAKEIEKQKKK